MFENLQVFQTSAAMARHAGQQQALASQNVANADTPGYAGKELAPFASHYATTGTAGAQRATRAEHLHGSIEGSQIPVTEQRGDDNPNGNTVSLETELLKAAEAKSDHERALAIYKSALDIIRMAVRTN
ncbi:flagellar basal-body rod protein FlgB [Sulfitobacter undariae]|uniref:Flagellar basal-body rod protein FlgB n=1 Tax=Sulfitobacter undariae TaxID=1563671 RepID=A0A7W6H1Y6_9RHOB|nr:FlgB family protein [Sulfitobacter undariae]MBB3994234.1 flagellar basal-body rod protein FlgB [Sulfitobacter undariae]